VNLKPWETVIPAIGVTPKKVTTAKPEVSSTELVETTSAKVLEEAIPTMPVTSEPSEQVSTASPDIFRTEPIDIVSTTANTGQQRDQIKYDVLESVVSEGSADDDVDYDDVAGGGIDVSANGE